MQDALLPLFPLEAVLLPYNVLPLHIFEERYKEMIGLAIREKSEFGVVQAGDKGILNLGCTAHIEKVVNEYPDGRMDILTVGRRRFEILFLDQEKSYLRGAVNFFDDEDQTEAPPEKRAASLSPSGLKTTLRTDWRVPGPSACACKVWRIVPSFMLQTKTSPVAPPYA